jgi:hypothetical protein
VFPYLAIIVGATISVAALIVGIVVNVRLISAQYYKLNIRLNRADQQNLAVAFILFSLPTLLAVLYLVADAKTFTIRTLAAVFIGVFCVARALTVFDRELITRISHAVCGFCMLLLTVAVLVWLNGQTPWTQVPHFLVSELTSAPGWESRLTFYAFAGLSLAAAIVAPMLARRRVRIAPDVIVPNSQAA